MTKQQLHKYLSERVRDVNQDISCWYFLIQATVDQVFKFKQHVKLQDPDVKPTMSFQDFKKMFDRLMEYNEKDCKKLCFEIFTYVKDPILERESADAIKRVQMYQPNEHDFANGLAGNGIPFSRKKIQSNYTCITLYMLYKLMFNDNHTISDDITLLMKKLKNKNKNLEEIMMYTKMSNLVSSKRLQDMYGDQYDNFKTIITPEKKTKKKSQKVNYIFKNMLKPKPKNVSKDVGLISNCEIKGSEVTNVPAFMKKLKTITNKTPRALSQPKSIGLAKYASENPDKLYLPISKLDQLVLDLEEENYDKGM